MAKVRGKTQPRLETPKRKGKSKGKEFAEWVAKYADPLLPWQKYVSERMMVTNSKGEYVQTTQVLSRMMCCAPRWLSHLLKSLHTPP